MEVEIRRAEPSDVREIKEVYDADNWLNLKRIEITVYVDNKRAIGLYKKFGFEVEGESKDYAFRNGKYVNAFHMARVIKMT